MACLALDEKSRLVEELTGQMHELVKQKYQLESDLLESGIELEQFKLKMVDLEAGTNHSDQMNAKVESLENELTQMEDKIKHLEAKLAENEQNERVLKQNLGRDLE